jgi:hypothetical protein
VRRIFKPVSLSLDRQLDEAIERFRQHKLNVEEEARTCHMIEAAEERNTQVVFLATERRLKLLRRLSALDCLFRHRKLNEVRHGGSGGWLLLSQQYQSWETMSDESSVLCCYGIRMLILAALSYCFTRGNPDRAQLVAGSPSWRQMLSIPLVRLEV